MSALRLNRRQWCGSVALASLSGAAGTLVRAATPQDFRLRYAVASSLYGTTPLAEILPEVARQGSDVIDLWPRPHGDQREQADALGADRLRQLLERHHARLGMTTRYDLGPLKLADELRYVKHWGGRLIVTGSVGPKSLSGPECRAAVVKFVEALKPTLELAEELGVTIGIENHAKALIDTPDSLRYLAELSPTPRLGIALAPYHLPHDEKLLAALIADLGPRLVHFYAWQHGQGCMQKLPKAQELEQMPGRGRLDFRPLLAALKRIDYQGWTQVFMHPVPRGIPILDTPTEVTAEINRARAYLDALAVEV